MEVSSVIPPDVQYSVRLMLKAAGLCAVSRNNDLLFEQVKPLGIGAERAESG
jgi:hypothetical protein